MVYIRALIILVLLAVVPGPAYSAVLFDRVVAVVNQEVITWSELYKGMEAEAAPQVRDLSAAERTRLFKSGEPVFLDNLINYRLQIQEARNIGLSVSDDEVGESIDSIKKKYSMTDAEFRESIKKEGLSLEEYKTKLKEQILIGKIVNHQIRNKIVVTDLDIDRFLSDNKDFSMSSEGYRLSQIFFRSPINPQDRQAVSDRAEKVYSMIRKGESFKDLAKKFSEEPQGENGGEIGLIKKEHMMKTFKDVITGMKQGDVSSPFWSERGLHIIRLDETVPAKSKEELREDARRELTNRVFSDKYNSWLKYLREKAFVEIKL